MKRKWKTIRCILITVCLLMGIQSVPALAATKNISSVSVRVGTDTELGEVLPSNIVTFDDSLEAHDGTYAATNSTKYYVRDAEWVPAQPS